MRMGTKIILLMSVVWIGSSATKVEITTGWKPELGFVTECSWTLYSNDSLQSVRLYNNEQQFMIYRPENNGREHMQTFPLNENFLEVHCVENDDRGVTGKCILTLELFKPPVADLTIACEVSGERPMFRMLKKDIIVSTFVPPTEAVINVVPTGQSAQSVILNCTSTGLPAPSLSWTVGDQKVPHDFSGVVWNKTSKLWHSWSLFSYSESTSEATCTPEVNMDGQLVKALAAMYSGASRVVGIKGVIISILLAMLLR
ncbi:hypothetical protein O3G_MSEX015021 [Manduca sexta]|uniref:Ig-like domain-containing protein n=1 Tax=Manduca sexta TaxID=7130 RepID=A0A921ZW83_MANSE|nr:hypothetical protein O3G_MSEX015021 [Manduca sexta]